MGKSDDTYFYPFLCCCECKTVTQDWKWVAKGDEVYGVCEPCAEKKVPQ